MKNSNLQNIKIINSKTSIPYSPISGPRDKDKIPQRDRNKHGDLIKSSFQKIINDKSNIIKGNAIIEGTYVEFDGEPGYDIITKSLEDTKNDIKIMNIQKKETKNKKEFISATVFIPDGAEKVFLNKVEQYLDSEKDTRNGNPKNMKLINSISKINPVTIESFWIGDPKEIPNDYTKKWCEVWVQNNIKGIGKNLDKEFKNICKKLLLEIKDEKIDFEERSVYLIKVNKEDLNKLIKETNIVTEVRLAPETSNFFIGMSNKEQSEWVDELKSRVEINKESNVSVSILDTGINKNNKIISDFFSDNGIVAYNPDWNTVDDNGHGTNLAGIAAYFNLEHILQSTGNFQINHDLESAKILPDKNENEPELYGHITDQVTNLLKINRPKNKRIICLATTTNQSEDGKPSSWSAAIDNQIYNNDEKLVFLISAGNTTQEENNDLGYFSANTIHCIESPGQAWNALTVGAYTNKITLTEDVHGGQPVADAGDLSPYSSTSILWQTNKWPIKPDIVCEGGNLLKDAFGMMQCDDLSLLTAHNKPIDRMFDTIWGTSAAVAQASFIAAEIQAKYNDYNAETIRGLMIHSAEWTDKMKERFIINGKKTEYLNLLKTYGYGIPNLSKAIKCSNNSVNMIIEDVIQPYIKENSIIKLKEMNIHKLPWPKEVLLDLGEENVKMRVTLSYFIEPLPGERGWKDKYKYASCNLRFEVNNSDENEEDFKKRINKLMREDDDDKGKGSSGSDRWTLGKNNRCLGSIHSDIWEGTAADLSQSNYIAVYPISGWWKEKNKLEKYNNKIRYSLIVSLETPNQEIDLYTPIITEIKNKVPIEIKVKK